ncbi:MAG: sigma-70 family RNA polymerase sigma factor [Ignavibacteria bacterium]|nr:sigma-70 family RNA polymerase sigma factor [Ignavibacteria bacterium]
MNSEEVYLKEAYIHYDYFNRIAVKLTNDVFEAEDLVQETFIRAYRFINTYKPGSNAKAWLYRIMKNLFINYYRKKMAHPVYSLDTLISEPASEDKDPALRQYELTKLMEGLKNEYRQVLILFHLKELSLIEISNQLNWPVGTVKSRLHRGRKELRKVLSPVI